MSTGQYFGDVGQFAVFPHPTRTLLLNRGVAFSLVHPIQFPNGFREEAQGGRGEIGGHDTRRVCEGDG